MTTNTIYTTPEKQLITTLAWFRSRYALFMGVSLERKADRQSIEEFGKIWIGDFKEDWEQAFASLCEKNILSIDSDEYSFTDYGQSIKNQIEFELPFYKYEYDNFFHMEKESIAHSLFCEKVYGANLSQHGLIDQAELSILIELLQKAQPSKILDIGCGNGRITEWIAEQTQIACVGIDISSEGIQIAQERTKANPLLRFEVGNLNNLQLTEQYGSVLFLDTLYYSSNMKNTITQVLELLEQGCSIYAYFSQWIMDESYSANLQPDNTYLAKVVHEMNLNYAFTDLSESGKKHWKRKLEVLDLMKKDFIAEGNTALWEYRYREAYRYAQWGDTKYSRYLYEIKK